VFLAKNGTDSGDCACMANPLLVLACHGTNDTKGIAMIISCRVHVRGREEGDEEEGWGIFGPS